MKRFPTFEAEIGHAVALGRVSQTLADISVLARYKDLEEARAKAKTVRRVVSIWKHALEQLRLRIRDVVRENVRAKQPKNVVLAKAHEINASQNLSEEEVNAIVVEEVFWSLPEAPRRRHGR